MTERAIIFSGWKARYVAGLAPGQEAQTRRVVTSPGSDIGAADLIEWRDGAWRAEFDEQILGQANGAPFGHPATAHVIRCPYGAPGDRLWCREAWRVAGEDFHDPPHTLTIDYRAGGVATVETTNEWRARYQQDTARADRTLRWRPSIYMPRWASRTLLDVTAVRVERVQDITEADAQAEGVADRAAFADAWDAINAKRGHPWSANCFVWVLTFRRAEVSGAR